MVRIWLRAMWDGDPFIARDVSFTAEPTSFYVGNKTKMETLVINYLAMNFMWHFTIV